MFLQIDIIVHYRLQAVLFQIIEDLIYRSSVRDLKLVITLIFDIFHMASDSCADTCGDLGRRNIYQIIPHAGTLSGGYRNACKRHKQTIRAYHLKKLRFVYILRVDPVVVDDRTKSRAGKSDLCVWIFSLQKRCV